VASPSQSLALYVGEAKVINQSNVNRIAVGNGKLVSATVVDDRQILLIGEGTGTTVVHVWLKGGAEYDINLTVVQNDNAKALQEMRSLLANTKGVHVGTVGDKIVLAGEYADQEAVQRVKTVTDAYPQVLNMIAANQTDTKVYPAKMVYLDVKVVEVRKSALERLGIKWGDSVAGPTVATTGYFYADTQFRGVDRPAGFPITTAMRPFTSYVGIASQLASTINFLEQSGDGWTLAEPRLSCQSGQKARFQVGGEIPIAVSAGFGQTQVVYKPYGIILEFEPTADNDGNVNTKLGAEVSEIDGKNSSTGLTAFTKNRTDTVVTMKANETLVLSGLLKNTGAKAADQLPGLGSIPLIGALFRNKQFANERTELVVLVTPRMISADSELNKELVQRGTSRIESVRDLIRTQMAD
jgi:pilus assembly protein CpaC